MAKDHEFGFETLCLHAGALPDPATASRVTPIYQTSSYVFDSADHAASLFNLQTFGNIYTRISNPTTAVFEERMAALENGRAGLAVSSGMAASTIALLTLLEQGDHIVAARTLYGGTHSLLDFNFKRFGIEATLVDADDPAAYAAAIRPNTKVVYAETIGNPVINVLDIAGVADVAHDAGVPLMIDNTFPTPYLCRPFDWGADIVIHSATKFLGGHGTTIGGVIVESGKFPWDNGKFPGMTEPSAGYHGVRFYETFGDFGYSMRARLEQLRVLGSALSPFNSFLLLQGIETLPVRMDRHCANALAVAQYLADHPLVEWVRYPGLAGDPYYALAQKYVPKGASGILSFGIRGGQAAGARFIESVQFLSHLANVGDAKTLVIHPASTTHRQMSEEQQIAAGVAPDMVRLSVGLETLDDILWDLDQALHQSQR
ncbi:MAG: O-acetylhomoserine aminocarboxypropyltransferase/cysteine synthase [Gammaproteobacteria bacterium]|nr:O-acetylhomoserine aminocarboxypropyltransferase/cysteine synthase [Gammaproteobacteria bacterium]